MKRKNYEVIASQLIGNKIRFIIKDKNIKVKILTTYEYSLVKEGSNFHPLFIGENRKVDRTQQMVLGKLQWGPVSEGEECEG
jgi:hypothetical protein